jgi:CRISPR/Cas system-associated exonuclease Cas4 (RecB family)
MSIEYGKIEPYSIEKKDESQEAIPMNFTRGFSSSQHIRIKPEEHRYADSFFESSPLHYGRIMHKLFENMKTLEDLDTSLQILLDEGEIKQTKKEELKNTVQKLISNKWVYQWFSGNLRVLNEQEIILPQGFKKRPDRVMIDKEKVIVVDYKFGQSYSDTHFSQVRSYMQNLKKMGYSNPEGYLWYVEKNEVIAVNYENTLF